jgi:ribonuclease HI
LSAEISVNSMVTGTNAGARPDSPTTRTVEGATGCRNTTVSSRIVFLQINLQHSKAASAVMCKQFAELPTAIAILQEPWIHGDKILGLGSRGTNLYRGSLTEGSRSCILVRGLDAVNMPQYGTRDLTAVRIEYSLRGRQRCLIVASVYLPIDGVVPSPAMENLAQYCEETHTPLVVGCDSNAHHMAWGCLDNNTRGTHFAEYVAASTLEIINTGCEPTFVVGNRHSIIDVTLATSHIVADIHDWQVSGKDCLSDHKQIQFFIGLDKPAPKYSRNPRNTNWECYDRELQNRLGQWIGRVKTPDDIEHELATVQNAIMDSYETACPLRRIGHRNRVSWWHTDLTTLRKQANRAFHNAYHTKTEQDWENHRQARRDFKRALRRAKRESWRLYCQEIEGVNESARITRILGRCTGNAVGMLKLPTGAWTQTPDEALNHLLSTHFPGCTQVEEVATSDDTDNPINRWVPTRDWELARNIVTERRLMWAFRSMSPFKSPGEDKIFPALIQKGMQYLATPICYILRASLAIGYIPKIWQTARVAFVPKPGRLDYSEAKSFRPISLTSFLLKGLEKLVDRFLREGPLMRLPLHPRQHAFQAGKSTESALHQLVERLERAVEHNQFALAIFFDIEGAFNNVTPASIDSAMKDWTVATPVKRWISTMLSQRKIYARLGRAIVWVHSRRGLPQGGGLSPLLWSLIADSLLKWLTRQGIFSQGFADDGVIVLIGIFLATICEIAQRTLRGIESWCSERELSVNPSKTEMVLFTHRRKIEGLLPVTFYGKELKLSTKVKYLGVWLDSKLNWKDHVDHKCQKALAAFYQVRRAVGKTWGLSPKVVHWIYTVIIRPMITYAAVVWWRRTNLTTVIKQLERIQRITCLYITGAMRTTPTAALELLVGIPPLHVYITKEAMASCYRLQNSSQWVCSGYGHTKIRRMIEQFVPQLLLRSDRILPKYYFDNNYCVQIKDRAYWKNNHTPMMDDVVCYTDGSKLARRGTTGAGIYFAGDEQGFSYSLGRLSTVFQAEVYALLSCALHDRISKEQGLSIAICSDSQAALRAVSTPRVTSSIVTEAVEALRVLATFNSVRLIWVPGHSGIPGNERADLYARRGAGSELIGPEPFLGLSTQVVRTILQDWAFKEQSRLWQSKDGCRQAKALIPGPSLGLSRFILQLTRKEIKNFVGLLTGHVALRRHLFLMKRETDPMCLLCQEEEDTAQHFLGSCCALMEKRQRIMGQPIMDSNELRKVPATRILRFIRTSRRFI